MTYQDHPKPKLMKGIYWEGNVGHVSVKNTPRPTIKGRDDIIVRITTAGICGSDLHILHGIGGATDAHQAMGHEAVGIVVEVGSEVKKVKIGQRVVIPDGFQPAGASVPLQVAGAAFYGLGNIIPGGEELGGLQSEYARVPLADQTVTIIPEAADDDDWLMLSDIFPTAWIGLTSTGFEAGDSVTVFGCGPVGLLAVYSAILRGASKVYAIDHIEARLAKAKSLGAIPIDLKNGDPAVQIGKLEPRGITRIVDAVGYECVNAQLQPETGYILNQAIQLAASYGGISATGVYIGGEPSPGSPRLTPALGLITFDIGSFWFKNLHLSSGIAVTTEVVPQLKKLVETGRAKPGIIVDRYIHIDDVPQAYLDFDSKKYGKTLIKFSHKGQ